ncbi:MAG: DUF1993 domain-containing protein [Rhodospirillaceae bacterium]|nr:DUF1993 domain-containing protein [Rhodospirillaceae bacterium]
MSLGMYDLSVPAFNRALKSAKTVLTKAEAHATEKKLDPNALLLARLYPDMFHFTRQIQMVTNMAQWGCALLAGQERPSWGDIEPTFAALNERVQKTVDFVASFKPEQINGCETKPVQLKFPNFTLDFTGTSFLLEFILPNLYFHSATAYGIMRHNGVVLSKSEFLARG